MDGKKLFLGYISGLFALFAEFLVFAFSFLVDAIRGIFPESASNLSSSLSTVVIVGFLINLVIGIFAALELGGVIRPRGILEYAAGFLAGVLTDLLILGGAIISVAPQIVSGLWWEFFTVFIPIFIIIVLAIVFQYFGERRRYSVKW